MRCMWLVNRRMLNSEFRFRIQNNTQCGSLWISRQIIRLRQMDELSLPFLASVTAVMFMFSELLKRATAATEKVRVVELRRAEGVVCKLSLAQIASLPTDEAGYSLVKIGD